ncbi:putative telomere end binding protein [Diplodia seriata]|uniref:Putative telomere end binding protein n=1 Tax=Diplodia seriata TaxID=420778 RepID=A0A0G2F1H2_9PEZI|nr:putative telomere end binding protein [Diplodia seriata]
MTNDVAEISRSPKLTDDTTLIEPSQSQKSDAVAMTQSPKPTDDTTLVEPSQSSLQTAAAIKHTSPPPRHSFPSQQQLQESLSQGTRTSYSYFTSLANLRSYINSPSQLVDILAVCTRPNKPPVRAAAGPRDYHTIFSITDASLLDLGDGNGGESANDKTVRVQVFRPWKAALPELDVGDAVLLRGFAVKSSKKGAMLVSGEESAWCVFRYRGGPPAQSEPAVPDDKNEAANGRSGEQEQEESKNEKRKSTIMDSTRPIWADVMSGLWGAVAPSGPEEQEVDQPQQQQKDSSEEKEGMDVDGPKNGGEKEAMTSRRNRHHHRHYNPVSGASKEEVHGPPVEYGDEERRRAWEMREWWVSGGGGDGAAVAAISGREENVGVEEEAEKSGNVGGESGREEGESESMVVAVEENGEVEEGGEKQKNSARDHFRSFL